MSFYNGILNHDDIHGSGQIGQRGLPGVGFKLDDDGNYDIENKKLTNVKNGDMDHDVMVKSQIEGYVSTNFVEKNGDTMTGPLIIPKDSFPIQGDLNKVISYEAQREIFLSKKEGGRMEQPIDMGGFAIENLKSPTADDHATSKVYVDNNFLNRLTGGQIGGDLDMRGHSIKYLKFDKSDSAAARVAELNSKADKSDLDDYFKLDGTKAMTGNINMNNNRIVRLPDPQLADEPVTRKFLTQTNTLFYNIFLDLDGNAQMRGNIKMNNNHITGLTNFPNADDQATNKKYVDDNIRKANIKPSHTPKNVFKYLMDDVNEWSSEYNVKVENFSNLVESPHSWDKRVLNITPIKDGGNYRFRLGLQMFPMGTNKTYSLIVELYNRDYKTWLRQQTFVEVTGIWLKSYNTSKFQHQYGSSGDLYYTKTLIKFKKTSDTAPIFVYFTIHFDDDGGDMNTYPKEFKNQVYIVAYGIVGETDHVDSEVYDAYEAFEIDKNRMKMLVPLDMNGKQLMNVNLNLKFSNIFKIIKCDTRYSSNRKFFIIVRKDNHHIFSFSAGVFITSITFHNKQTFNNNAAIKFISSGLGSDHEIKLSPLVIDTGSVRKLNIWLELNSGFRTVRLMNLTNNLRFPFDVDFVLSNM